MNGSSAQGFWFYRPGEEFPPEPIRYPAGYAGGDRLNIACTQTELSAARQKKLVHSWCEILPTLSEVEYLWFSSRVSQELFDAAVQAENLKGLFVKWSGIRSIDRIPAARGLQYLHIGSSPSLAPLEPLLELPRLVWLELENIRASADLTFAGRLKNLQGLSVAGDGNSLKYLKVRSVEPLESLHKVYWLSLTTLIVEDGRLWPLRKLRSLKHLFLSNKYEVEEIARLAGARPDVQCDLFQPVSRVYDFFTCKKCGERTMVMPTGKGMPLLCVTCDRARIERHGERFRAIAERHRGLADG